MGRLGASTPCSANGGRQIRHWVRCASAPRQGPGTLSFFSPAKQRGRPTDPVRHPHPQHPTARASRRPAARSPCSLPSAWLTARPPGSPRTLGPFGHASLRPSGTSPNLSAPWERPGIIYEDGNGKSNHFKGNGELNNCHHGSHEIDLVPD